MARAIIGGLFTSTLLTLIVLPTYYLIANRWWLDFRLVVAARMREVPPSSVEPEPTAG
jgi:hypothetical protein